MKSKFVFVIVALWAAAACAQHYTITLTTNNTALISYSNTWYEGVATLQGQLGRKWVSLDNFFTTQRVDQVELPLPADAGIYSTFRLRSMSVVPGNAFARLALAYGNITTVGGTGPTPTGTNLWRPEFEGANATAVPFSDPRAAVTDHEGNIYVVERETHAVLVIRTNGTIHTAIGDLASRSSGTIDLPPGPPVFPATAFPSLNRPSGLYYSQATRILYILDAGNARVLKYQNGLMSKLFSQAGAGTPVSYENGGSLWVSPDELEAYYTDGNVLKHWEAENAENGVGGVTDASGGFIGAVDVKIIPSVHDNDPVVVDRGDNRLYRVRNSGTHQVVAGTGLARGPSVGDARRIAFPGPTSIATMPIGGFLLGTADGRVWYVDTDGDAAPLIHGRAPSDTKPGAHDGDGQWFRRGGRRPKISSVQSVDVAPNGDIILLEGGFVRRIEFLRSRP